MSSSESVKGCLETCLEILAQRCVPPRLSVLTGLNKIRFENQDIG